jgi:Thoeris protein ThsB, TIR-like domain
MANRTGTYVAFDGQGEVDPTKSDFRYYATIQAWSKNKSIDFQITNSHEKASAVRDKSKAATLKASIQERLRGSKNMLIILSKDTRKSGSVLSYEIKMAIDTYKIPLIISYVDYSVIANPISLSEYFPKSLTTRIREKTASAIHIPFSQKIILQAVNQFSPSKLPNGTGYSRYIESAYRSWGLLEKNETFQNKLKEKSI